MPPNELHLYENAGVTGRALTQVHEDHLRVSIWYSRPDLIEQDPHAAAWLESVTQPLLAEFKDRKWLVDFNCPGFPTIQHEYEFS